MSIGEQVDETVLKLAQHRYEAAIIPISVALSATARREYPTPGDKKACHDFLNDNVPMISKIGWMAFGLIGPTSFIYRQLTGHQPGLATRTTTEMLYDVMRCTAVHEAKLPDNLRFTPEPMIQTGKDGELVLPIDVIYGLLIAVVASPTNADEHASSNPVFSVAGWSAQLNELWGKRKEVEIRLGLTK